MGTAARTTGTRVDDFDIIAAGSRGHRAAWVIAALACPAGWLGHVLLLEMVGGWVVL